MIPTKLFDHLYIHDPKLQLDCMLKLQNKQKNFLIQNKNKENHTIFFLQKKNYFFCYTQLLNFVLSLKQKQNSSHGLMTDSLKTQKIV